MATGHAGYMDLHVPGCCVSVPVVGRQQWMWVAKFEPCCMVFPGALCGSQQMRVSGLDGSLVLGSYKLKNNYTTCVQVDQHGPTKIAFC